MKLIDSSIWLELLAGGPLMPVARTNLERPEEVLVPTMVMLEVYKWLLRERGEEAADAAAARMMLSRIAPLDAATAIQAAQLCRLHHLATADATILAHAQLAGVVLLTCDRHFQGIPDVEYLPKGDT